MSIRHNPTAKTVWHNTKIGSRIVVEEKVKPTIRNVELEKRIRDICLECKFEDCNGDCEYFKKMRRKLVKEYSKNGE